MSYRPFAAELRPERSLRRIVLLCGCSAVLIGVALLIRLPLPAAQRAMLTIFWIAAAAVEIGSFTRGVARTRRIVLTAEGAAIIDRRGRRRPVRIMSGSLVLPRLAWLRLRLDDGLIYGELLRGDPASCRQWRRLQILWRQDPGIFGGRS